MATTKKPVTDEVTTPAESTQETPPVEETKPVIKGRSSANEAASYDQTVSDMKSFLATQPVVSIFIPLEPGEPKGTLYPVEMNGYKVKLPKNTYVDVPKPIAEIVKNSLNVYEEASSSMFSKENGSNMRLDLKTGEAKSALDA